MSKLSAEQYVNTIGQLWGIETVALRIFNAYGPGQPLPVSHPPVVPRFLRQALTGGSVVLYGSGAQTRDFIYVTDVVAALIEAATAKKVNRKVINIASGRETSIAQLVNLIEELTGRRVNRVTNPDKTGGVSRLVADISRAEHLLGFRPQVTLADGLRRTMQEGALYQPFITPSIA